MMPSEPLSSLLALPKTSKRWLTALTVVAVLGFIDAAYLTAVHYLHIVPPCSVVQGCEQVTTSVYSTIGPVPVALLGAMYYLVMALLGVAALDAKSVKLARLLVLLSPFGFLASIGFVYLQLFVIEAICLYCLFSALTSTLIFVFGLMARRQLAADGEGEVLQ